MFLFMPTKIYGQRRQQKAPLANSLVIAANVLAYFLGLHLPVGPGTSLFSVFGYAFTHASLSHLMLNMWLLWIVGNAVNRCIGNTQYLVGYGGIVLVMGLAARLSIGTLMAGSSGAIFGMVAVLAMLMPSAKTEIGCVAVFPLTILLGILKPPSEWVYWLIRWDRFKIAAWNFLFLIPILQITGIMWWGWNWTHAGHLLGFFCGIGFVLLLPNQISMPTSNFGFQINPNQ